jgi:hypothetical protein
MRDGIVAEGGAEYAIRPLPVNERFATRSCAYCCGAARERLDHTNRLRRLRA